MRRVALRWPESLRSVPYHDEHAAEESDDEHVPAPTDRRRGRLQGRRPVASPRSGARRSSSPSTRCPGLMAIRREYADGAAAARRADHRLAAHDDPDRGADRDPGRARRRGALGVLQHLLHPGPRRRGGRGRPDRHGRRPGRRAGLRLEGRDPAGVLVVHRAGAALAGRRRPQHDPRRRRRRHPARPQGQGVRGGRRGAVHRRAPTPRSTASSSTCCAAR